MNRMIGWALVVAVLLGVSISGCSYSTPTSPTPTGQKVTETFTGTVSPGGSKTHAFSATAAGPVTATLTALSPDSTTAMSVTLGTFAYEACSAVVTNNNAKVSSVTIGTATSTVNLCLVVADIGYVKDTASYSVTVTHY